MNSNNGNVLEQQQVQYQCEDQEEQGHIFVLPTLAITMLATAKRCNRNLFHVQLQTLITVQLPEVFQ